mgnify:CR=1 FL=1
MKKIYSKPTTEVAKMQLANMIANSLNLTMYGTNATGTGMSRDRGARNNDDDIDDLW